MHCGMDLKEWTVLTESVRQRLRNQADLFSGYIGTISSKHPYNFLGMFDYEWETRKSIWEYLHYVQENNEDIWDNLIGAVLPSENISFYHGIAVIPKESAELLLSNLSIEDNIIITIPKRISSSITGIIRKKLRKNIADDFCSTVGINMLSTNINQLSRVHKKILSIYRWEVEKPQAIFLESPYGGMNQEEIADLRKYLERLSRKGIQIIYFAKSLEEMKDDCKVIITTHNGKCAKMNTIS
jgi:ABC-type sugar transport system ATPase subunit